MSVNLIKWTPRSGEYAWIYRPRAAFAAGQIVSVDLHARTMSVRIAGSRRYVCATFAQAVRHPQTKWGA